MTEKSQLYSGVETVVDLFLNELSAKERDKSKVLVFHGTEGIGKSTLCKEICSRIEKENKLWGLFDFCNPSNKELDGFLISLRNHFNSKYDFIFPSFDIAYSFYWQKTNPNLPLSNENFPLNKGKGPVKNILRTAGELPYKSFVPVLTEIFNIPGSLYKEWWKRRGKNELANIFLLDSKEILLNLPFFWAADFKDFIKTSEKDTIIFLDSYESLRAENKKNDSYLNEELIQKWIMKLNEIFFVIASRDELDWPKEKDDGSDILKNIRIDEFLKKSSSGCLDQFENGDGNIINFVKKECNGIQYLLDLASDICREIKSKEKREPVINDFADLRQNATDKLFALLDKPEIDTLKILSLTLSWNGPLLVSLINDFNTGYPVKNADDLKRFTFIKESDLPGFYTMEENIRESIQSVVGVQMSEEINKYLFEYYNELIKSIDYKDITDHDKKYLYNAFHYAKMYLGIMDFAKWFINFNSKFNDAGQYKFILPLVNELTNILKENKFDGTKEYADIIIINGIYYKGIGKYKEAENLFRHSMKVIKNIFGEESKEAALCMTHLANVLSIQGEFSEAEPLYLKVINYFDPLKSKESTFSVDSLINMGMLFAREGKHEEAISLFEKTLNIRKKTQGEDHPDIQKILTNIANIEFDRKNFNKAELLYREILDSLKIYYGENHPEVSKAMINLGNVLIELKNYSEATSLYEKAKEILEKFYGKEHPDYAITLNNLAYINFLTGNFESSKRQYLVALNIYKNILGTEHPDLAILYNNLGRLYVKMKNFKEAEVLLRNSLEINIKKFGLDNPETGSSYESLGELNETLGNIKEALFYYQKYETILTANFPAENPEIKMIREKILKLKK